MNKGETIFTPSLDPVKRAIDEITQMRQNGAGTREAIMLDNLILELRKKYDERTITPDKALAQANQIMGHIDGTV